MVELRKLATYTFACNVGRLDRVVRLLAGIALVVLGAFVLDRVALRVATAVSGVAIAMTGVVSRCGIYYLLGTSTRGQSDVPASPRAGRAR